MRTSAPLLSWCLAAGFALAAAAPARAAGPFDCPVDDLALAEVRGGFSSAGGGLVLSFAVQRSVYVDGVLVAGANDASTLLVVQRGAANSALAGFGSGGAIVLQNSLSGGSLQAVTTIDAVVNSLQLLGSISLQTSLRNAVVDSLRR